MLDVVSCGLARRTRYVANRFRVEEELEFPLTIPGERDMMRTRSDFLGSYGGAGNPYDGHAAVYKTGAKLRLTLTRSAHCE